MFSPSGNTPRLARSSALWFESVIPLLKGKKKDHRMMVFFSLYKGYEKDIFSVCIKDSNSNEFYVVTDLDDIYINVYLQILLTLDIRCLFYKQ